MILERENLRVIISERDQHNIEQIEILDGDRWIPILKNRNFHNTLLFYSKNGLISNKLTFDRRKKKKLYYSFTNKEISVALDYCLEENNMLHIRYKIYANKDFSTSKMGVFYDILLGMNPDFTWVPHIRPKDNLVIGDHVFRSPVIIYKKNTLAFAFIPDLKTLGQNRPFPSFMDFNLKIDENQQNPYIAYCFGNYKPYKHVFFKHVANKEFQVKAGTDLTFRYYIITFNGKSDSQILQSINEFFWQKYVRRNLYERLAPQVLPYEINALESYKAIFERHKYWGDIEINDTDCGGFWGPSWLGQDKDPLNFIGRGQIEDYLQTYSKRHRIAVIFNTAWFLNIRSAYGLRYFGEMWERKDYIEKSKKMLNLILELPRVKGVFPSLVLPSSNKTNDFSTSKGVKAWWHINSYNLVDTALAMYWAIKMILDFNIKANKIEEKSKELADFLRQIQNENGSIPIFVDFAENEQPIISMDLINSASVGAFLMFLIKYYELSKDSSIIPACEKIYNYIKNEIIPQDKWHDFEALYSCTYYSLADYDYATNSNIMNNLCIYWCAEGLLGFYKIRKDDRFLELGEAVLARLSLFQQVWDMPYISYNTFGGFGCQNDDAELGDARTGLFVNTYMQYYLETGKEEYMERAIAALRAVWVLQLLSEYQQTSPGNLKGIDTVDTIDRGCISENYGHFGKDERIDKFILFDWGNGTACTATAIVRKFFGDVFIDFKEELVWGINGVLMKAFNFTENYLEIECEIIPKKQNVFIKGRYFLHKPVTIKFNEKVIENISANELNTGFKMKF